MSYFQSFHFSIFSFPEAIFLQNAAFPEFCSLERLISKVFIFRLLASQKLFFRKTLHFRSSALWNVLFPKFSFFDFYLPTSLFSQNAASSEFCTLECLISKVFMFRFLASQKLFFSNTCI